MSRILFPDTLDHAPNSSTSHLDRANNNNVHSFKAPYRPGKIPTESLDPRPFLKRTQSIISLPSPPSERKLRRQSFVGGERSSDGETTDPSETDGDGDGDVTMGASAGEEGLRPAPVLRAALLRPVNARNPFLDLFEDASRSNDRPDHPQQSPTQQARRIRRKVDIERIQLGGAVGGTQAEEEHEEDEEEEVRETKVMKAGWDDPNNPFLEKNDVKRKSGGEVRTGRKPDQVVYVFRGKRIAYDVPFDALISADPSESPFADPSPKLLFPPAAPTSVRVHDPTTPPSKLAPTSSFLDALRKSNEQGLASPEKSPVKKKAKAAGDWGTSNLRRGEKRMRDDSFGEGLGGVKKWRGGREEVEMEV